MYAKCFERKCREIVESKFQDDHCSFHPGRRTTDQIFTQRQIFEKSWKYASDVFACFVDLEKAYDWVSRDHVISSGECCKTMALMGIVCLCTRSGTYAEEDVHLLMAIISHSTVSLKFVFV